MKKAASAGFEPTSKRTDARSFQAIISSNRFERFASVAMAVRLHVLVSQTHVHSHELLSWVIARDISGVQKDFEWSCFRVETCASRALGWK